MKRNDAIIFRKFIQIMLPAFGTGIAVALNEFVDSILVSQLLGSEAMAIVNVCSPLMLFAACMYQLFGIGGSIVYSRLIGEKREKEAQNFFGLSMLCAFVVSVVTMVLGIVFRGTVAHLLVGESSLSGELETYLVYSFLAYPFVMVVMAISCFLPAMNHPVLASSCAITANAVNLVLDYVFIKPLNQGVHGAAMATLAGYVFAGMIIVVLFARKTISLSVTETLRNIRMSSILEIVRMGISYASIQLGFALTVGFRNNIAASFGNDELVSFSFFMQLGSIISIFLAGVCDGAVPVYSLLYGADDRQGIRLLTKKGLTFLEICSVALVAVFLLFPGVLLGMFDIESAVQKEICLRSMRTFAVYAPFRSAIVYYRNMMNAGGRTKYATVIAMIDSIIGIFVFSYLGSRIWGIDGLWYAYVLNVAIILLMIVCYNTYLYCKSGRKLSPFYLLSEERDTLLLDLTIFSDTEEITGLSEKTIASCKEHGVDHRLSTFAGLTVEEMAVYTRNHCGGHQYLDVLIKKEQDGIRIDFRSIGQPFNPMVESEQDAHYNVELLNKLVDDIIYAYAMGLNTTTILLKQNAKKAE